ncbi:MAG: hypothetical protein IJT75_01850 [Bacteroidaceae bacterium]|nr:hypothetical protein [Bacteroidaceae bacterium]
MKKILSLALISAFIFSLNSFAGYNEKTVQKRAKQEAKELKKQGFEPQPGALPLEMQLENCYKKQLDFDDEELPKYYMGNANTTGTNYDAARMAAGHLARTNLATEISTQIAQLITDKMGNKDLEDGVKASISQVTAKGKELIVAKLSNTTPLMECFRKTDKGLYEVRIRIFYSKERADKQARAALRAELEKESDAAAKALDQLMDEE